MVESFPDQSIKAYLNEKMAGLWSTGEPATIKFTVSMGKCALSLIVDTNINLPAQSSLWQLESGCPISFFPTEEKIKNTVGIKEPEYGRWGGQEISEKDRVARLTNDSSRWLVKLDFLRNNWCF